jgi:hypothetical protein
MKLLMENFRKYLIEEMFSESTIQHINDALVDALEEYELWAMTASIERGDIGARLREFGQESTSAAEYKQKIKDYLNSEAFDPAAWQEEHGERIPVPRLGDAIYGEEDLFTAEREEVR